MPAFVVVSLTPLDADKLKAYSDAAGPTVRKHSGEFVGRGPMEALSGEATHKMQALIQFPTREHALNWYNSDEYQALIATRNEGMDALFTLVG